MNRQPLLFLLSTTANEVSKRCMATECVVQDSENKCSIAFTEEKQSTLKKCIRFDHLFQGSKPVAVPVLARTTVKLCPFLFSSILLHNEEYVYSSIESNRKCALEIDQLKTGFVYGCCSTVDMLVNV